MENAVSMTTIQILFLTFLLLPMALSFGSDTLTAQQGGSVPTRSEVEERYTWDVTSLFPSDDAWERAYAEAEEMIGGFEAYDGILGRSADDLLACLRMRDEVGIRLGRLFSYAARKRDVDLANTTYQAMSQRMQSLGTNRNEAIAFIEPEILSIDDETLETFFREREELRLYEHYIDDIRRLRDHVNEVQMSRSRYHLYMRSPDRRVRHDAYKALYVPYENHLNTMSSLLVTRLKTDIFNMKSRKFGSSLESALSGPNIPVEVYHNLVRTLNENLGPLYRWAAMKKRVLGVDELHPYDTYAPLFPEVRPTFTYEEAQEVIRDALRPLGEEVGRIVERAFEERWIDVYENVGKRGGAYSSGTYGVHPYILMNFNGTLGSVFTLAHELGHTIHSYLSNESQPYIYSSYATFNAEVASTTNEALLMDHLLERAGSDVDRLSLLQQYVQEIGSTFYRQGRFAEFELAIHERIEREEPLTHETLNKLFGELYRKYWGPEMVVDAEEKLSWARIPHFYYNYYVYTYATSYAASQLIAKKIAEEGRPAVEKYLTFLSSGGSDYPIELLKIAGVDMSTPEPIEATAAKMDELLDRMEDILERN
jgi:oligoendopeptidase F